MNVVNFSTNFIFDKTSWIFSGIVLAFVIIFAIILVIFRKSNMPLFRIFAISLLIAYTLLFIWKSNMLFMHFFNYEGVIAFGSKWEFNFIPFDSIREYISADKEFLKENMLKSFILWFVWFIPFWFLLPIVFEKISEFKKFLLFAFLIPFSIEFLQFFIKVFIDRSYHMVPDVDDVLIWFLWMIFGFLIYKIFEKIFIKIFPQKKNPAK